MFESNAIPTIEKLKKYKWTHIRIEYMYQPDKIIDLSKATVRDEEEWMTAMHYPEKVKEPLQVLVYAINENDKLDNGRPVEVKLNRGYKLPEGWFNKYGK